MKLFNASTLIGAALSVPPVLKDINEAKKEGRSTLWAGTSSAVRNNWMTIVTMGMARQGLAIAGLQALQFAPALTQLAYGYYNVRSDAIRLSATPFSSRFEHSDWTARAQQRGLASISGARGIIGSEASSFAARYGRR